MGSPLPNKSDIGQAADQTTVLLFPSRTLILIIKRQLFYYPRQEMFELFKFERDLDGTNHVT